MGVTQAVSPTARRTDPTFMGRVIHDRSFLGGGTPLTATDTALALGAGWGGTASYAIAAGSFDTLGSVTVTASATTPAQATATITLTFVTGAFRTAPKGYAARNGGTGSALITAIVATTTTTLVLTASIIPVAAATYTFDWIVIPVDEPVN